MRDYSVLNGMIENQKSELRTAYDKGYNQGVRDFDLILATSKKEEEGYNRGMNDLWESVCKFMDADIVSDKEIWGCTSWEKFAQLSPSEVIERLKEYNKKQEHIVRCCKNCKHSENGMVGNGKRCADCHYDRVSKGNTLFEPMETDNSKIEVGDVCRYQTCERIFIITSIHEGFGGEEYFDAIYSNGEAIKNGKLSVIEKINGECVDKLENIFSDLINICISGKADA